MADTCDNGHPKTPANTYANGVGHAPRCAPCERARGRAEYDARHAGHQVITVGGHTLDGLPRRRCVTCTGPRRAYTPPEADDGAVLRAVQGDPPPNLNVSERRAAIRKLYGTLPARAIAERVGVTPRTVWRHVASTRTGIAA
jgi:predicted DNA-binding protein (UPF0251 family)